VALGLPLAYGLGCLASGVTPRVPPLDAQDWLYFLAPFGPALAADREALAVALAAVATQVDQALDGQLHLAAKVALDGELLHLDAQALHFRVGEVLDLGVQLDLRRFADDLRAGHANTIDRLQRDARVLVVRDVHPGDTGHALTPDFTGLFGFYDHGNHARGRPKRELRIIA